MWTINVALGFIVFKSGKRYSDAADVSVGYQSPRQAHRALVHVCDDHEEMLPDKINPVLMPDTMEEARVLLLFLDMTICLTIEDISSE